MSELQTRDFQFKTARIEYYFALKKYCESQPHSACYTNNCDKCRINSQIVRLKEAIDESE